MMEISDLITFSTVARCAGITRAAKELNTVQSNVTSRIKNLEDEVGVALFERHSRGVALTSAGLRLLPYASRITMLLHEATDAARDDGVALGSLRIGTMETTLAVRLPEILADYHSKYPNVELIVQTGPTAELVQKVLDNEIDGAFVAGPINHSLLEGEQIFNEKLVLITSRNIKSLADLQSATIPLTALMFREGCAYRKKLEQLLISLGRPHYHSLEFGTLEGILGCVAAGVGIALLPEHLIKNSNIYKQINLHEIDASIANTQTIFIRRTDVREGTSMKFFKIFFDST